MDAESKATTRQERLDSVSQFTVSLVIMHAVVSIFITLRGPYAVHAYIAFGVLIVTAGVLLAVQAIIKFKRDTSGEWVIYMAFAMLTPILALHDLVHVLYS